jgi:hypothetical protein
MADQSKGMCSRWKLQPIKKFVRKAPLVFRRCSIHPYENNIDKRTRAIKLLVEANDEIEKAKRVIRSARFCIANCFPDSTIMRDALERMAIADSALRRNTSMKTMIENSLLYIDNEIQAGNINPQSLLTMAIRASASASA